MSKDTMNYVWRDYDPETMMDIENWLDESAVRSTGLEDGFCSFYEYWIKEDGFCLGENFWCKVVYENGQPFAVIAFCRHEDKINIMEVLIDQKKRGRGKGSKLLKELLGSNMVTGFYIQKAEAVIYPDNIASQKAFENAGFKCRRTHKDEDGESMIYIFENCP